MKKPYIKKFCDISSFKVWIVDGRYIRENIDEEFTNYGQNYRFSFIPKNEFWIDKERTSGEEKYYIDSMLAMNRLLAKGISHDKAVEKADAIERRERAKSNLMRERVKLKKYPEGLINSIHKKLIKNYSNEKVKVWVVDGEAVRGLFFIDFTEGGHSLVYPFIPKDEIWLDDDLSPRELKFVLLHELHERNLMKKGWTYASDEFTPNMIKHSPKGRKSKKSAHFDSARIEYYCRKHPGKVEGELKRELKIFK